MLSHVISDLNKIGFEDQKLEKIEIGGQETEFKNMDIKISKIQKKNIKTAFKSLF